MSSDQSGEKTNAHIVDTGSPVRKKQRHKASDADLQIKIESSRSLSDSAGDAMTSLNEFSAAPYTYIAAFKSGQHLSPGIYVVKVFNILLPNT